MSGTPSENDSGLWPQIGYRVKRPEEKTSENDHELVAHADQYEFEDWIFNVLKPMLDKS